jgi:hypothetical protein
VRKMLQSQSDGKRKTPKTAKPKQPCRYDFRGSSDLALECVVCRKPHAVFTWHLWAGHDPLSELQALGMLAGKALAQVEWAADLICASENCGEQATMGCTFCGQHCPRRRCKVHRQTFEGK